MDPAWIPGRRQHADREPGKREDPVPESALAELLQHRPKEEVLVGVGRVVEEPRQRADVEAQSRGQDAALVRRLDPRVPLARPDRHRERRPPVGRLQMDEVAQRRLDCERTRLHREVEDPIEPELVWVLQGEGFLVAADEEAHPRPAVGRLDLDQSLGARRRVERTDVVARAVAFNLRHPAEVWQEVFPSGPGEAALLLLQDEFLALPAKSAVAGVPGNRIELARQPEDRLGVLRLLPPERPAGPRRDRRRPARQEPRRRSRRPGRLRRGIDRSPPPAPRIGHATRARSPGCAADRASPRRRSYSDTSTRRIFPVARSARRSRGDAGLPIRTPGHLLAEHGEIVGDKEVILGVCPIRSGDATDDSVHVSLLSLGAHGEGKTVNRDIHAATVFRCSVADRGLGRLSWAGERTFRGRQ